MKDKTFLLIISLAFIFSCRANKVEISKEVNVLKFFTDSILRVNEEFIKGVDTIFEEVPVAEEPGIIVIDSVFKHHSNLFDTSHYCSTGIIPTLYKYNSMEQHLDSLKNKMDKKTLALFESIKQKMNEIKQPIK